MLLFAKCQKHLFTSTCLVMADTLNDVESVLLSDASKDSYGWEKVSVSLSDDESLTLEDSSDADRNKEVSNQEEDAEESAAVFQANNQGIDRKMNTSKAHELSASESSSEEQQEPSTHNINIANSRTNLHLNTNEYRSCKTEKHSSNDSNDSDSNSSAFPGMKEMNIQTHKHNNLVDGTEDLSVENIDFEEVWLVQCPLDLDPKKLVNKELDFAGISEFEVEIENTEKAYTAIACAGRWKSLSCLLPSMERKKLEAVVVNAAGQIVITEQIMNSQSKSAVPAGSNIPKFPENLKVRHPLFGADYEKELDIRKQRLLVSSPEKKRKKKKKKLPKDVSYGTTSEDQAFHSTPGFSEDMEAQAEVPFTSKKAKKRRYSESCVVNSDHSNNSDDDSSMLLEGRYSKKRLRKSLSVSVNDSVEIDSSQNQYRKKKKKKKCDTP